MKRTVCAVLADKLRQALHLWCRLHSFIEWMRGFDDQLWWTIVFLVHVAGE